MTSKTNYIFGTSVIGSFHIKTGIPCQDACAYESLPFGWGIIAVADGLGSASKSDIGAKTAVDAVIRNAKGLIEEKKEGIKLHDIATDAVIFARNEVVTKAIEEQCNLHDLATTLIVAIICENNIAVVHMGDGGVVVKKGEDLLLISGSEKESEYINEVEHLTGKSWKESLRVIKEVSDIECIAVFTDGCELSILHRVQRKLEPYDRFFRPLFHYAQELDDVSLGDIDIRDLLVSQKFSKDSEDDKTLVVSVLKNKGEV